MNPNDDPIPPGLAHAFQVAREALRDTGATSYSVQWAPDDPAAGVTIRPQWGTYCYRDQHPDPPAAARPLPPPDQAPADLRPPLRLIPHPAMKVAGRIRIG